MKEVTIKLSQRDFKLIEDTYDQIEWGWNGGYYLERKIVDKVANAVKKVTTKNKGKY